MPGVPNPHTAGVLLLAALALAACGGGTSSEASAEAPATTSPSSGASAASAAPADPTAAAASAGPQSDAVPTRVAVPALDIDLPVVPGDLEVEGNLPDYPLCDVAQYLTTYRYPGRPGTTTWIYAHAREGMFLPLLEASQRDDGADLVGEMVEVHADDGRRYTYRITEVLRHATDRSIARDVPPDDRRLVLQTSEGPRGTVPKLQVAAAFVAEDGPHPSAVAMPSAEPRVCHEE